MCRRRGGAARYRRRRCCCCCCRCRSPGRRPFGRRPASVRRAACRLPPHRRAGGTLRGVARSRRCDAVTQRCCAKRPLHGHRAIPADRRRLRRGLRIAGRVRRVRRVCSVPARPAVSASGAAWACRPIGRLRRRWLFRRLFFRSVACARVVAARVKRIPSGIPNAASLTDRAAAISDDAPIAVHRMRTAGRDSSEIIAIHRHSPRCVTMRGARAPRGRESARARIVAIGRSHPREGVATMSPSGQHFNRRCPTPLPRRRVCRCCRRPMR